jgi:hypothetical protein
MTNGVNVDIDFLRAIILGKVQFRKCPCCDMEGLIYFNDDDSPALASPKAEWGDEYHSEDCENCDGLAFIQIPE